MGLRKLSAAAGRRSAIGLVLDDGKTVKFLDIGGKFLNEKGELPKAIMPDYLHLSEDGYRIWADAIAQPVEEMLK